jgi:hypothetical protein
LLSASRGVDSKIVDVELGMLDTHPIDHAGDPRHPEHGKFLAELGRATYAAARVTGIAFDILRIFGEATSAEMYSDPLGKLVGRLATLESNDRVELPDLAQFIVVMRAAKATRNDLIHALPVKDGLHRRETSDLRKVRNFFDVDDVAAAAHELEAAWHEGSRILYHDGGAAVRAWYAAGGS